MSEREVIPVRELERAEVRELVRAAAVIMAIDPARTSPGTGRGLRAGTGR